MHSSFHEYAEKLKQKLPKELDCIYLVNSGSEAVELAIKMAKLFTGRQEVISLKNSYHGASAVALAATGICSFKYPNSSFAGHFHVSCVKTS